VSRPYALADLLEASAGRAPEQVALVIPGGARITYAELDALSDRLRDRLWHLGVRPGDRVGFRLHKSIDSVVTLFGILKTGAAYVPVDAESPAPRGAYILNDCQVKVVITERSLQESLERELGKLGASPSLVALDEGAGGLAMPAALDALQRSDPAPRVRTVHPASGDIAYILYTSGSTGNPKGVVLTHGNAASFVDWCARTFDLSGDDVFSSHAPFHFDLSILDIFVSIRQGARLVLIGESLGKDPLRLAAAIAAEGITVWYSTPSILSLLADYGKLERHDCSRLRVVFFAGEVFPIPRFAALRKHWSWPRYVNLYGPTETNVCTWYEVPPDESWKDLSTFPIGRVCPPNQARVVDDDGVEVAEGGEGELVIHGTNVMRGYWNLPEHDARAFHVDADGRRWYRTGDIVRTDADGHYRYLSRKDRMVKRRGYRVELGEIEAGLAKHPDIREAAVVAVADPQSGVRITAFVSCHEGKALTIIALKSFSSQVLPPYMIPDAFKVLRTLPLTSTDKVDLQALRAQA
jgi:amino acid adenylation domain-containing protein